MKHNCGCSLKFPSFHECFELLRCHIILTSHATLAIRVFINAGELSGPLPSSQQFNHRPRFALTRVRRHLQHLQRGPFRVDLYQKSSPPDERGEGKKVEIPGLKCIPFVRCGVSERESGRGDVRGTKRAHQLTHLLIPHAYKQQSRWHQPERLVSGALSYLRH